MIIAILVGFLVGFVLAMPPGPIGVTAIQYGLLGNIRPGIKMALGTALLDMFYCLAALFATKAAMSAVGGFSIDHPYIMFVIQLSIVLAMVIFGILNLKSRKDANDADFDTQLKTNNPKFIDNLMKRGPFLLGIALSLTNLPNPTFLPSIAYVTLNVQEFKLIESTTIAGLGFALGFGIGNFVWLQTLVRIVNHFKERMSTNMITRIRQFAGITFVGFGTFLGYRLAITHWSDVFKLVFAF